jgi:phosphoglucomutase
VPGRRLGLRDLPEKHGILAGLLCCEMVRRRGKPVGQQLRERFAKVGSFYLKRDNFCLTPEVKEKFTEKLLQNPHQFFGRKVKDVMRTDRLKFICGDGAGFGMGSREPNPWCGYIPRARKATWRT